MPKMWRQSLIYLTAIYLVGVAILLYFALTHFTIISDNAGEYALYLGIVKSGQFSLPVRDSILSTSLVVIWLPAFIQRILHTDPVWTFKLYSVFLTPILPVTIYLLAKRYFDYKFALVAPAFVMAQHYFLLGGFYTRLQIALIFVVLSLLVISSTTLSYRTKLLWLIPISAGMVVSHYGTTFLIVFVVGLSVVINALFSPIGRSILLAFFIILTVSAFCWYYLPDKTTFYYLLKGTERAIAATKDVTGGVLDFSNREGVLQAAFGEGFFALSILGRILFGVSWLTVIILSIGLPYSMLKHFMPFELKLVSVSAYVAILLTIAIPTLSVEYGIFRVYFTALMPLILCFLQGIKVVATRLKVNDYLLAGVVTASYAILWALALY